MSGSGSANVSGCTLEYDREIYLWAAVVRVVTGSLSLLCGLLIISFFVYTRKQRRVTNQILVFYFTISISLHSLSHTLGRANFTREQPLLDRYCLFAGPLELYTAWTEYMCILCISCNLLAKVTCQPAGRKLHLFYCSLIFGLPLSFSWIPFAGQAYGSAGPWCGIRSFTENCQLFPYGVALQVLLVGLPVLILLLTTILFSLATWLSLRHRLHTLEVFPQQTVDKAEVQAELRVLLWCPPLYPALLIFLLVNLVYHTAQPGSPQPSLWLLEALTSPLAGSITALVIGANTEANARARLYSWLTRHLCWQKRKQTEREGYKKKRISEYECELNVSYGDSLSGMADKNRRERVRKHSGPSSASE